MSFPLVLNDIMSTIYFETRTLEDALLIQSSGIAGCGDGINFAVELFCIFAASYSTLKRGHCRIHLKRYVLFAPESAGRLFTGSLGRISYCYTVHNAAFVKQPLDFGKMFYNYKVKPPKIKYCANYRLQCFFFFTIRKSKRYYF